MQEREVDGRLGASKRTLRHGSVKLVDSDLGLLRRLKLHRRLTRGSSRAVVL